MGYLLAALLGGFFLFNSQATPQRAERAIEKVMAQRFTGATVDAEVEGKKGRDVLKGRFRRVKLSLSNFDLAGGGLGVQAVPSAKSLGRVGSFELSLRDFAFSGVRVGALDVGFGAATFDWKALKNQSQLKVVSCEMGTAKLSVTSAAIEPFLKTKLKDVQEMKLSIAPGNRVKVTGKRPAPIVNVPMPFEVAGRIEVRNGREIWLVDPTATMGGIPLAAPVAKAATGTINPLYVFGSDKSPFAVQITNLTTGTDNAELLANLSFIPAKP